MKLLLKIIGGILIALFLFVGGIIPLFPNSMLDNLPKWAEWPILICGMLFLVIGLLPIETNSSQE